MPITAEDLRWFQSERMTDEDDGGGRMSGVEIVCGEENQVFDDLSDVDRAAGDVSIRKVYAAVASASDDKYLDAGVVVFRPPADPDVSVNVFSTGDAYDERADLKDRLESSVVRGGQLVGTWLWGHHTVGQRSVTLWQRLTSDIPPVGDRIELAQLSGGTVDYSQVVWIVGATSDEVVRADEGNTYVVRQVTLEIAEALVAAYDGSEPSRSDPHGLTVLLYEMRYNPDAMPLVGIKPLSDAAGVGDYTVKVDSIYSPLIPTAFAETPLADVTPGGDAAALVNAGTSASFTTTLDVVKPGGSLFLGSPVMPGTLSILVSGSEITDAAGVLLLAGTDIGAVAYSSGVCVWNDACPAFGTASKAVAFQPGANPLRIADTAAQAVTLSNRGFVWVQTISPIPAPGSLRVAYRANGAWYVLADTGDGTLRGSDSAHGSGTLNFGTGTVTVTTGALPDPESSIMYAWATPINYTVRGGGPLAAPVVRGQTVNPLVHPGTVTVSWTAGSVTDTNGDGVLAGAAGNGRIDYENGNWWVQPNDVPAMGTEFTVDYDYGDPLEEVTDAFVNPALDGNGDLNLTLSQEPVPGTLRIVVPMNADSYIDAVGQDTETIPPVVPEAPDPKPDDVPPPWVPPPKPDQRWCVYSESRKWVPDGMGQKLVAVEARSANYTTEGQAVTAAQAVYGASSISGIVTVRDSSITIAGIAMTVLGSTHPPSGSGPHTGFDTTSRTSTVY